MNRKYILISINGGTPLFVFSTTSKDILYTELEITIDHHFGKLYKTVSVQNNNDKDFSVFHDGKQTDLVWTWIKGYDLD